MGEIKFKKFLNHIEEEMHVDLSLEGADLQRRLFFFFGLSSFSIVSIFSINYPFYSFTIFPLAYVKIMSSLSTLVPPP